jgi:hypothetical protein
MGAGRGTAVSALVVGLLLTAAVPASAERRVQVDAGGVFSCAVKSDAALACWGTNTSGQATPPAGSFTEVGSGGFHACALRSGDVSVACWGSNASGQLNNVPAGSFTAIAAGANHTCALKGDGSIACWGDNGSSQARQHPHQASGRRPRRRPARGDDRPRRPDEGDHTSERHSSLTRGAPAGSNQRRRFKRDASGCHQPGPALEPFKIS